MSIRANGLLRIWAVAAVLLFTTACGGGGNNDNTVVDSNDGVMSDDADISTDSSNGSGVSNIAPLDGPPTWSVGPATYTAPASVAGVQQNIAGRAIVLINTGDQDSGNAEYSGSQLTLQLSQGGTGDYTVVDNINLDSGGSRVAFIVVTAGTEVEGLASSKWASSTGLITVQVDNSGSYHASTLEPLTLSRDFDQGTGVPNSPDQISFTMSNVFGRRL